MVINITINVTLYLSNPRFNLNIFISFDISEAQFPPLHVCKYFLCKIDYISLIPKLIPDSKSRSPKILRGPSSSSSTFTFYLPYPLGNHETKRRRKDLRLSRSIEIPHTSLFTFNRRENQFIYLHSYLVH